MLSFCSEFLETIQRCCLDFLWLFDSFLFTVIDTTLYFRIFLVVLLIVLIKIISYIVAYIHEYFHYRTIKHYYCKDNAFTENLYCEIILTRRIFLLYDGYTQSNYLKYLNENKATHEKEIIRISRAGFRYSFLLGILLNVIGLILFFISCYFAILEFIFIFTLAIILIYNYAIHKKGSKTSDTYIVKHPSEFTYEPRVILDEQHYEKKKLRIIIVK